MNQVWSLVDVNTTLLSKDSFELKRNDQQAVFPVKKLIRINNNFLFGEETFPISCEHRHEHAVFAHASPLLKAINPSQKARLFRAKKETLHHFSSNGP